MIDIEALKNYAYDTIGAIHEVHKELGPGLNEKIYQEGLQLELSERKITFKKELTFHPMYHGKEMEATYRLEAQLFNYMRLLKVAVGILVNFYPRFAEIERYFFNPDDNEIYGFDGFPVRKYV